jgi:HTH-type transcriptional regulator / antitoxin HipB
MSYPIRLTEQLKPHMKALRKARGLTQAQLGELIGVKQARMAEIEAHPGTVSLEQLVRLLSALGATLHLHVEADPVEAAASVPRSW